MYKVIVGFADIKDNRHIYKTGDKFPRDGVTVSDERLEELSTSKNRRGIPLIKETPIETNEKAANPAKLTETENSPVKNEKAVNAPKSDVKKAAPKKRNSKPSGRGAKKNAD